MLLPSLSLDTSMKSLIWCSVFQVEGPWVVSSSGSSEGGGGWSQVGINSLVSTSLQLRLPLAARHFGSRGSAKVRCVSSISTLFWQEGEEKVFGSSKKLTGTPTHRHSSASHHTNERDSFRFDSPSSSSAATANRHNYYDSSNNNNLTPNPVVFNSTALVTGN
jgi:hypothetical protein